MKFIGFQEVMSIPRISRYLTAAGRDSRKAMTLYRLNLRLSQELFTVISCFEVALRNRIDQHYSRRNGNDWLRDAVLPGHPTKDTSLSYCHYALVRQLFKWMQINEAALLYGIDHITKILKDVDKL